MTGVRKSPSPGGGPGQGSERSEGGWPRAPSCRVQRPVPGALPAQACGPTKEPPRPRLRERGQTLVVAALLLLVLLACLALSLDLGNIYAQRRLMQNAADAGALAGVRALALGQGDSAVRSQVQQFAVQRNGADGCSVTIMTSTLTVVVSRTFSTFFAGLVGMPTFTVFASAEAGYGFPGAWNGGLMPIAVHEDAVGEPGVVLEIWDDEKTPSDPEHGIFADGQRGWLNFDGGSVGNSELVDWITNGYPGRVEVGDWVNGTPGTKTAALHALDAVRTGTTVFVPIYDQVRAGQMGNGKLDYHIVAFGAFHVVLVVDTGNPKFVQGYFRRYCVAQEGGGSVDTGVRVLKLSR